MQTNHKVGFIIDIDGTLTLSRQPLPGAPQTLQLLKQNNIPFLLLTNNVAKSELAKAKEVTQMLKLPFAIEEEQVVLNYTPIKHKFKDLKEEIVLIVGREFRLNDVLPLPEMEKYITVQEYIAIFQESAPMAEHKDKTTCQQIAENVKKRLNLAVLDKHQLKIGGVVILTTPTHWEEAIQIIIDVLSTPTGHLSQQTAYTYSMEHIPVMTCYNDLFHCPTGHNLPRLLMKPFTQSLKTVYKLVYGHDLNLQMYGKPTVNTFNFAKQQIQALNGPIQKLVMIGDNIESDIMCPYDLGWDTILVKTGVHKQDHHEATINCSNILEGVKEYLKRQ